MSIAIILILAAMNLVLLERWRTAVWSHSTCAEDLARAEDRRLRQVVMTLKYMRRFRETQQQVCDLNAELELSRRATVAMMMKAEGPRLTSSDWLEEATRR